MRKYEIVCIVHPDLDENAFKGVIEKVRGWITDAGGKIDKEDVWGKRKMAYPISKQNHGQYVLLNISIPPAASAELDRNLRFLEPVMRYMIVALS